MSEYALKAMRIESFLRTSPIFAVYTGYSQIVGQFQHQLNAEEVHFIQALILTGIFFEERAVRPTELAQTLKSSRSNISHALRALEKRGWIERTTDPADARAYYFQLTKSGRKKALRLIKIFDHTQTALENTHAKGAGELLNQFFLHARQFTK